MFTGIPFRSVGKRAGLLLALTARFAVAADLNVPDDFTTIQAAIDAAANGDTVVVAPGTYTGNIQLKSGVDVRGEEAARTFLEPEEPADAVVLAEGIDDVLFGNFTIFNALLGFEAISSTNLEVVNTVFDSIEQVALEVDEDSQVDVLNCVFWNNQNAIRRGTEDAVITNVGFVGNVVTINSPPVPIIDPDLNVDYCGFFDNEDLKDSGVDLSYGTNAVIGDPLFAETNDFDFHLQEDSPFIDVGLGTDIIDNSAADIGVYGGEFADARPYPVVAPTVSVAGDDTEPPFSVNLEWPANLAYLVTNTVVPGSYRVYYRQNESGPPYDGNDAGNGTLPSPVEAGNSTTLTLDDLEPVVTGPQAPVLQSVDPRSGSVVVSWGAVSGVANYRVYYGIQSADENEIDTGDVTSLTVSGLENGIEYRFAVSALAQPVYHFAVTVRDSTPVANESVFSPESTVSIGPLFEGLLSNELTATPDDVTPYPDLPDDGCFVATAAFGVDWTAQVQVLRDFRDRFLLTNRPGRTFVRWYYRNGPQAAALITEFDGLRPVVRALLWPFVIVALFALTATPVAGAVLALLCLSLLVARRSLSVRTLLKRKGT